ncbi:restriction endonuclease subunit S [Mumia sp. DW29H23]|uniref:restriction endonuclease subunit S n=1 Tax=Mumia sp. DW29H23 TaxID=3421241 RepID=UPI003D68CAB5
MSHRSFPSFPLRRFLRELTDGPFGSSLTASHYSDSGARVIRLGNIGEAQFKGADEAFIPLAHFSELQRHSVDAGDLLIAGLGDQGHPVGRACLAPAGLGPALVKADCFRARLDEGRLLHRFAAWALNSRYVSHQVLTLTRGSTRARINLDVAKAIEVPVPPLGEQRAIADYLDRETTRIDTLVEEQQHLIDLLRERRRAVVSAAFAASASSQATRVGRLLVARPSYGVLVPTYVDESEGVPFVRVGDILRLEPDRPLLSIAASQSSEYSRTQLLGGEVLLGVVGKMGQATIAPEWLAGANVARAVAVLRCKDSTDANLLCAWLGSVEFLRQAELATSGDSIQPTLGMKDLARFEINLPMRPDAIGQLSRQTGSIDGLIADAERFVELARERRAALITAAVTGQIDVREVA